MIGRKIQNFKVLSLLGKGGMGIVYKVFDTQLERYAALKILNLNSNRSSSFVERFKKEARNQAKLSHPNIVSVYGFVQKMFWVLQWNTLRAIRLKALSKIVEG